jgi:hypothetical protein
MPDPQQTQATTSSCTEEGGIVSKDMSRDPQIYTATSSSTEQRGIDSTRMYDEECKYYGRNPQDPRVMLKEMTQPEFEMARRSCKCERCLTGSNALSTS